MMNGPDLAGSIDDSQLSAAIVALEADVIDGHAPSVETIATLLARIRGVGDDALEGRLLCLRARIEIMQGRNESAILTTGEGARAWTRLDPARSHQYAGFRAETFRAAGTALSKLGRVADALQHLQTAVHIAQAALDDPPTNPVPGTPISPASALMRSLMALGIALFFIREIDAAIDAYERALSIADAYPVLHEHFLNDVLLVHWNLVESLHERARARRDRDDESLAQADLAAAYRLIDVQAWRFEQSAAIGRTARAAYFGALGNHLLLTGKSGEAYAAFEHRLVEIQHTDYVLGIASAQLELGQAALALESPWAAFTHTDLALAALDEHDESNTRAAVLLVRAHALRAMGRHESAYEAHAAHHAMRKRLETVAAQQYAQHMNAQLGVERARAEAESHRGVAAMLESLAQIGQEMTAKLDVAAVFRIFERHVNALFTVDLFAVLLLDEGAGILRLAHGVEGGLPIGFAHVALDDPTSLAALAVRERREIFNATDLPAVEEMRAAVPSRMRSLLYAPLIVADRVLGVATIQSERTDAYRERECSVFRMINSYAAIALDNASAYTKLEQTIVTLEATQSELARQNAELERLSLTDALTGVANRRALGERAQLEIAALRREPGQLAVVMFDIDHFKRVNDDYGHAVGDAVLVHVASVARRCLRPGDLIARVGGEEFALLLPSAGIEEAAAIAERIRTSILNTPTFVGERQIRVTSSFGVASYDDSFSTLDHALGRADSALYRAKEAGRDRVAAASSN
jgi:diguanylate cyclase (GGDEF)-like protein